MIIGLMLATTAAVSTYALVKHHQKIEQEKEEYNRLLEQKHIREHYASAPNWNSSDTFDYSKRKSSNDRVKETHSTTIVNNYHDDCGSDDGTGAFAGAMLGTMVGNAMTQPVMPPVAPIIEPSPVIVEPTPTPDVVQVPPENDGSSDVTYDGDSSTSGWNDSSNDETPQNNPNDGGSDVTYDGDSSSTDWGSSSNDSSNNDSSGWSSDTSSYDSDNSSYDSGGSFDSDGSW